MRLSVIIPTLNESGHLDVLLDRMKKGALRKDVEILVVDGGSVDDTCAIARKHQLKVYETAAGRARQMNLGANKSSAEVLYFVHADTLPPVSYYDDIMQALGEEADLGCYRFKFDSSHLLLKINAYFTRYDKMWCRGGDQSLFIRSEVFNALGGYINDEVIMEEYTLLKKAMDRFKFVVMQKDILVSARKYRNNGYFRVQFANMVAFHMHRFGAESEKILQTYRTLIKYRS
ncbi:MAG: glycosyltransferase family 2 protein [Saprospiraceae bacterium]|nr:glycosyltransferase family 2 protein [Saprospiraceae bacterium]